jgi:hypothetical protein
VRVRVRVTGSCPGVHALRPLARAVQAVLHRKFFVDLQYTGSLHSNSKRSFFRPNLENPCVRSFNVFKNTLVPYYCILSHFNFEIIFLSTEPIVAYKITTVPLSALNSRSYRHESHLFSPIPSVRDGEKVLLRWPALRATPGRSQRYNPCIGRRPPARRHTPGARSLGNPCNRRRLGGQIGSQGPHPPEIDGSQVDQHRHSAQRL